MTALASELKKVLCKKCRLEFDHDALFCPNCGTAKSRDLDGDPLLGSTIGDRYLLIKQIGQGTSGAIYLGEHVTLRRKVVVKVLHHELSRDDLATERFRREATTVGELDNDHIVQIYDFGRTKDGRLYLAMEYLEGHTLADIIEEQGQLEIEQVVDVLTQLGEALIEAHAMGYVHRDLRPRNLFLAKRRTRANYLKLLDFGLAKLVEKEGEAASTSLGMTFGDPHYMSPEQARGDAVDRRADIYSMGCIAYQMLSGEPPFHGGKVFDVLTRQVEETPRPLATVAPNTPAWLDRAVMRCLEKDPGDRYITVYRLVEALRQGTDSGVIMSDEVARRRPTNPPASISRAMERVRAHEKEGRGWDADAIKNAEQKKIETQLTEPMLPEPPEPTRPEPTRPEPTLAPKKESSIGKSSSKKKSAGAQTALGLGLIGEPNDIKTPIAKRPMEQLPAAVEPVAREPEGIAVDEVVPATRAAGKNDAVPKEVSAQSGTGLSAVWYADGETLEDGGKLTAKEKAKLDKARGNSPSRTGLMAVSSDEYLDELPGNNRLRVVLGSVGALLLVAVLAVKFWPSGESSKNSEASAVAQKSDATMLAAKPQADAAAPLPDDVSPVPVPVVAEPTVVRAQPKPKDRPVRDPRPVRKPKPVRDPKPKPVRDPDPPRNPVVTPPAPANPIDVSSGPTAADQAQAKALVGEGNSDLRSGDILGAASKFNKARSLDPRNGSAYAGLGSIALSQGAYQAAVGHLGKATKMRSKSARNWTLLGEAYLGTGANGKAASAFKRALKLQPDNARAREGYNEATGS